MLQLAWAAHDARQAAGLEVWITALHIKAAAEEGKDVPEVIRVEPGEDEALEVYILRPPGIHVRLQLVLGSLCSLQC